MQKHGVEATSSGSEPTPSMSTKHINNPAGTFLSLALSMSWQLAIIVLLPIVGGFKLDEHVHSSPLWTVVGFVVALGGVIALFRRLLEVPKLHAVDKSKEKK